MNTANSTLPKTGMTSRWFYCEMCDTSAKNKSICPHCGHDNGPIKRSILTAADGHVGKAPTLSDYDTYGR